MKAEPFGAYPLITPSEHAFSENWQLKTGSYLGMLSMGILNGAIGPLLVSIAAFYRLGLGQVGLPVMVDSVGYLLGTLIFSFVWRIHRVRPILALSTICLLVSSVCMVPFYHDFKIFLVLMFCLGFAFGFLSVGLDSLYSEVYAENRARYLNILHLFWGIGSFAGPLLLVAVLRTTNKWVLFYLLIGLCQVPLALFFSRKSNYGFRDEFSRAETDSLPKQPQKPVTSPVFWAILLAMFLNLGMELSFGSWLPTFLTGIRTVSPATASYVVSLFWLTFLAGRALYIRFAYGIDLSVSLIAATGGAALFMALTFLLKGTLPIFITVACAGMLFSIVYPNLIAMGAGIFPDHIGFVTGTLSASGGLGCVFFPWLIGPLSESFGLARGVFMVPLLGLGLVIICVMVRKVENKRIQATVIVPIEGIG
jgi:fucose permease